MSFIRVVTLDDVILGKTFCRSCATRHVYNILAKLPGNKSLTVDRVRENLTVTDTEYKFKTPPKEAGTE